MEPILDETSLIPTDEPTIPDRIRTLAQTIKYLDEFGAARVLRSVRDAPQRDIGQGRGLQAWCFDRRIDRDARLLIAQRLGKQPYVDGDEGLFQRAQHGFAVEGKVGDEVTLGLVVVALQGGVGTALKTPLRATGGMIPVHMTYLDDGGERMQDVCIPFVITPEDARSLESELRERILGEIRDGQQLIERAEEIFSRLRFGSLAVEQIVAMTGREVVFRQLVWHLHVLHQSALRWEDGPFEPGGVAWSTESTATLNKYGHERDFPVPDGFEFERWRLHTKLTGGNGARLYYRFETEGGRGVVLIGYFGDHLSTMKHP